MGPACAGSTPALPAIDISVPTTWAPPPARHPRPKPMRKLCGISLAQSLFIQPQTRQDPNYRTTE